MTTTSLPLATSSPQVALLLGCSNNATDAAAVGITVLHARSAGPGGGSGGGTPVLRLGETPDTLGAQLRSLNAPGGAGRPLHLGASSGSNALTVQPDGTVDVPLRMTARNLSVYGDLRAERWHDLVASHTSTNPFVPPSAAALGTAYRTLSNMIVAASFAAGGISNVVELFGAPACNLASHFLTTSPDAPADIEVNSVSTGTLRVAALGYIDATRYLNLSLDWKLDASQSVPASAYALHGAFAELSNMGRRVGGVYTSDRTIEWRHSTTDALMASLDIGTSVFTAAGGYGNLPIVSSISVDASVASNAFASVALVRNVRDQVTSLATSSFSKAAAASNAAVSASNAAAYASNAAAAAPEAPVARIRLATSGGGGVAPATLSCAFTGAATPPLLLVRDARLLCVDGYAGLVQDVLHARAHDAPDAPPGVSNVPASAAAVLAAVRAINGRSEFASNLAFPLGMLVATAPTRAVQAEWASNTARWASNASGCLSNRTAPRAVYASNVASVTSNTVRWASNAIVLQVLPTAQWASNGLRDAVWGSNTAKWASNVAQAASNLADETLFASNLAHAAYVTSTWASNSAVFSSNDTLPTRAAAAWASNAGARGLSAAEHASNGLRALSNAAYVSKTVDGAFSSNAAAWGSNAARWLSNTAAPSAAFASNAAVSGSNAGAWASNAAAFGSNVAVSGAAARALLSDVVAVNGAAARRAEATAAWASNAIVAAGGADGMGWASNALGELYGPAAAWASNAVASNGARTDAALSLSYAALSSAAAASNASSATTTSLGHAVVAAVAASNAAGMAATVADAAAARSVWASNAASSGSNWAAFAGAWTSNAAAAATSNAAWSVAAAALGSNTAVWASNFSVSEVAPATRWASNTALWASNAAVGAQRTAGDARASATWSSNLARSNAALAALFGSSAAWTSNAVAAAVASSAGAPFASNAAAWASNAAGFGSNAGAWTSNEHVRVVYASNGVSDRILWASNAAVAAAADAGAASASASAASATAAGAAAEAATARARADAITVLAGATLESASNAARHAQWASNVAAFGSNAAVAASRAAAYGSNAASFGSNTASFGSNAAVRAWLSALASSNALAAANQVAAAASNVAASAQGVAGAAAATAGWASNLTSSAMGAMGAAASQAAGASNLAAAAVAAAAAAAAGLPQLQATAAWASNAGRAASNEAFERAYVRAYSNAGADSNAGTGAGADTFVLSGAQLARAGRLALQLSNADSQSVRMVLDGADATGALLARGGADLVLAARDGAVVRIAGHGHSGSGSGSGSNAAAGSPQPQAPGNAVLAFPPEPGASGAEFTLSNVMYGDGLYAARASSTNGSNGTEAWRAFSYANAAGAVAGGCAWTSRMGYTTSSGDPNDESGGRDLPSTVVDGMAYKGDWLQIVLPPDRLVSPPAAYTVAPRLSAPSSGVPDGQPRRWLFAGSSDGGATWRMLDATYATTDYAPQNATISATCPRTTAAARSGTPMNAFRLVVLRVSVAPAAQRTALFVSAEVASMRVRAAPVVATLALDAGRAVFTGCVGVGTAHPAHALHLATDDAAKPASGMWTVHSDARLKESIQAVDLKRCYDIVREVPLRRYRWRDDVYPASAVQDRTRLGWIAQEVATAFPKAVRATSAFGMDDCLSLNSDQLMAALYGAVQHIQRMLEKGA